MVQLPTQSRRVSVRRKETDVAQILALICGLPQILPWNIQGFVLQRYDTATTASQLSFLTDTESSC
ncbi:unnamed protein product, partial [Symbiodinium pilosum]